MKKYKIKPYEVEAVQYFNSKDKCNILHVSKCFPDAMFCNFTLHDEVLVDNKWVKLYNRCYIVQRTDTGKLGVYSEEHFNRKFKEIT